MSFPAMLAVTSNANRCAQTGEGFPAEFAWLTGDGPIRSVPVAPQAEWLRFPLAVEEHGLTWDILRNEGKPLNEVLALMDQDLAGRVVYCYRRDFHALQKRKSTFELRWFETPTGAPEHTLPWGPAVSCTSATKWARETTVDLPLRRGGTLLIYALNYYSALVEEKELLALLDGWTQPATKS